VPYSFQGRGRYRATSSKRCDTFARSTPRCADSNRLTPTNCSHSRRICRRRSRSSKRCRLGQTARPAVLRRWHLYAADAALVLQLGAEAIFVGSGIFKSDTRSAWPRPSSRRRAFRDRALVAKVSTGLGAADEGYRDGLFGAAFSRTRLVDVARVGVLALQGDVREHTSMLERVGAQVVAVRDAEHSMTSTAW